MPEVRGTGIVSSTRHQEADQEGPSPTALERGIFPQEEVTVCPTLMTVNVKMELFAGLTKDVKSSLSESCQGGLSGSFYRRGILGS